MTTRHRSNSESEEQSQEECSVEDHRMGDLKARVDGVQKKMKWWQALAIAGVTAAGSALFGVAHSLYTRGEKEGANEVRMQNLERTMNDNRATIDGLRMMIIDLIKRRRNQE